MRGVLALAAVLAFTGCAKLAEDRVHDELVEAGLPDAMAECMAGRLAERLSLGQLRKLERLAPLEGEADVPLTIAEFLERVRRVDDPEVVEVTAAAAAVCAFSGI